MQTIGDWERARFATETTADLAALPVREGLVPNAPPPVEDEEHEVLLARLYGGLGVQLLWSRSTGRTHIDITLDEKHERIEVPPAKALDAFTHPLCGEWGSTIRFDRRALLLDDGPDVEDDDELAEQA